jgi:hypothetical protein
MKKRLQLAGKIFQTNKKKYLGLYMFFNFLIEGSLSGFKV